MFTLIKLPASFFPLLSLLVVSSCTVAQPVREPGPGTTAAHGGTPPDTTGPIRVDSSRQSQLPEWDVRVCVIQEGNLAEVTAQYQRATGDTIYHGQRFESAFPATSGYAAGTTWYINNERVMVAGRSYVPYGLPRVLTVNEVQRIGEYQGVSVFGEASTTGIPDAIYVPVRPGCEFQPYQFEVRTGDMRGESRRPRTQRRPPPSRRQAQRPGRADTSSRSTDVVRHSDRTGETSLGGIATRMPRRFRQGKGSSVTITLTATAPASRTVAIVLDDPRDDDGVRLQAAPDSFRIVTDTVTVSRRMRVTLLTDTVDGADFVIDRLHGAPEQALRADIPGKWEFQVTPLKSGRRLLYISLDLLSESDETHLTTIVKAVEVRVDRWWQVQRWGAINFVPLIAGSILIPLGGYLGGKLIRSRRSRTPSRNAKQRRQ